jgi:hypothetical protein
MRIGWHIPLPGPFSIGGTLWRSKSRRRRGYHGTLPGWKCPHNHSRPDLARACANREAARRAAGAAPTTATTARRPGGRLGALLVLIAVSLVIYALFWPWFAFHNTAAGWGVGVPWLLAIGALAWLGLVRAGKLPAPRKRSQAPAEAGTRDNPAQLSVDGEEVTPGGARDAVADRVTDNGPGAGEVRGVERVGTTEDGTALYKVTYELPDDQAATASSEDPGPGQHPEAGPKRPLWRRKLVIIPAAITGGLFALLVLIGTLAPAPHPAAAAHPAPSAQATQPSAHPATQAPATHAPATQPPPPATQAPPAATQAPAAATQAPAAASSAPASVYRAGEFCGTAGATAVDVHGAPLTCTYKNGLRWEH